MKKIFSKNKDESKGKEDIINKFFRKEIINSDFNIDESYSKLRRKLLSNPELAKDIKTLELIMSFFLYNINILLNDTQEIRISKNELIISLKDHDAFRYFLYNNRIDDNTLIKLIPYLKYTHYQKNEIICKEGEDSLQMYFILKGKVSVIKGNNKLNIINIINEKENFGQWDVIYHRKRKSTFYSYDESHIIVIEKGIIRKFLQDKMIKAEEEKKSFVSKFLKKYGISAFFRIERVIHNIKLLHFRQDEIIYKEGEINDKIYLIYKGEGKLVKKIKEGEFSYVENLKENILKIQNKAKNLNYKQLIPNENEKTKINQNKEISNDNNNNNNKKQILNEKSEYKILAILGRGCIGGLEISTGIKNKKYTLVANCDYTTVIIIELNDIKENINQFLNNLLPPFIQSEKEIHSRIKKIKNIDNKIQEKCQIVKLKDNNNNLLNQLEDDKQYIREIKKINKNFDTNEGGFIKMNDFNINLTSKKNKLKDELIKCKKKYLELDFLVKQYDNKENKENNFTEKNRTLKTLRKSYKINTLNKNLSDYMDNMNKIIINKSSYLIKSIRKNFFEENNLDNLDEISNNYRIKYKNINTYKPRIIKTERVIDDYKNNLLKEIIEIDKKRFKSIHGYKNSINKPIKKRKIKILEKNKAIWLDIYKSNNREKNDKIFLVNKNVIRRLFEKNMIKKNKRPNSLNIKNNIFHEKRMIYYNTGMYDMPFASHLNSDRNEKINNFMNK